MYKLLELLLLVEISFSVLLERNGEVFCVNNATEIPFPHVLFCNEYVAVGQSSIVFANQTTLGTSSVLGYYVSDRKSTRLN